jgi:D-alanine-D-alanine ligase
MKNLRVGVLFGGRSGEHEVSLLSAASVVNAIDKSKYEVVPIGITKDGRWLTAGDAERLLQGKAPDESKHLRAGDPEATPGAAVLASGEAVVVPPEPVHRATSSLTPFQTDASALRRASDRAINVDVIFPVLHGTFGEDGTIQGLLELADIPYVGAGVLGSAAGMDKDIMKALFRAAGLPIVKHVTILRGDWDADHKKAEKIVDRHLKYPVFVKPANLGSSVGISKAKHVAELRTAIKLAAEFDRKVVIEAAVPQAREIEVAVLGNDEPEASVPGEIIPSGEFYDYEAKYLNAASREVIPAVLPDRLAEEIRTLAVTAFKALDCAGMARVDFLLEGDGGGMLYINELNTIPGFTTISMYSKMWAASGVSYPQLLDRLIALAIERHAEKQQLRTSM